MINTAQNGYGAQFDEYKKFAYSFNTSDGDKININLSHQESTLFTKDEHEAKFSFKLIDSFQFKYEGNGISKQDKKEIQEALSKIRPKIEAFFKKSAIIEGLSLKNLISADSHKTTNLPEAKEDNVPKAEKTESNLVDRLRELLPNKKSQNHSNFVKSEMVRLFEVVFNAFDNSLSTQNKSETAQKKKENIENKKQEQNREKLTDKTDKQKSLEEKRDIFKQQMFNSMKNMLKNLFYDYDNISPNIPKYI